MFEDPNARPDDPVNMHQDVMRELDEIKRYAANTYASVDTEMQEVHKMVKELESRIKEMDRQMDKIEQFENRFNELRSICQKIERKVG